MTQFTPTHLPKSSQSQSHQCSTRSSPTYLPGHSQLQSPHPNSTIFLQNPSLPVCKYNPISKTHIPIQPNSHKTIQLHPKTLTCLDPICCCCCCIESNPKCGVDTAEEDEDGDAAEDVDAARPPGPTRLGPPPPPPTDCMQNLTQIHTHPQPPNPPKREPLKKKKLKTKKKTPKTPNPSKF